jgi:hypothetical protein
MMRKIAVKLYAGSMLLTLLAEPVLAAKVHTNLGGCTRSPENASLVLALIGGAAAGVPWARAQLRSRFGKRSSDE